MTHSGSAVTEKGQNSFPKRYNESALTQKAQDALFDLLSDPEEQDRPDENYIKEFDKTSPFVNKLTEQVEKRAKELGLNIDFTNQKELRNFLLKRLEDQKLVNKDNKKQWNDRLSKWIIPQKDEAVPTILPERDSVYQLCFALGMDAWETGEFFVKGYLDRPYNFKNLKEAVYFYCLNNNRSYSDAIALYNQAQAFQPETDSFAETNTVEIGRRISEFNANEKAFLNYIRQNRLSFVTDSKSAKKNSKSASKNIELLIRKCTEIAKEEFNKFNSSDESEEIAKRDQRVENDDGSLKSNAFETKSAKEVTKLSAEGLLDIIYFGYRKKRAEKRKTIGTGSLFPRLIRDRMVSNHVQLLHLQDGTASDKLTRSALILFNFYFFFSEAKKSADSIDLYDDFVHETDRILLECGYGQLYWRNPYDWMIGCCAAADNPIDKLRSMIDSFLLYDDNEDD